MATNHRQAGATRRELISKRMNMGLSAEAAAAKIGIARNTLTRFEAGESVTVSSAKLIADFFGVKVTDVMPLDGSGPGAEADAA